MTPYYEDSAVVIYHGDCREVLPGVTADVVVTDPPYGIALRNGDVDGHRSDRDFVVIGDDNQSVGLWVLEWAMRRNLCTVVFASPWRPWPGRWRNLIVWDKGGAVGGGGDIKMCLKRSWELIQVFGNGPMNGPRIESVWRFPVTPTDTQAHICAKPIMLMSALIDRFSTTGTILDPFMGSGTTLRAAKDLGRKAIGIEIEERYCEIAAKRMQQEVLGI